MTKREFMKAVIAIANADDAIGNAEVVEFAKAEITKLDERNAKRAKTLSKTALANEPIKEAIKTLLSDKTVPMTAKEISEEVEGCTSAQKASVLCRQMVDKGQLSVTEVKIKGKGPRKGYYIA